MGIEFLRQLKEDRDKPKEKAVYRIPKISKKRAAKIEVEKELNKANGGGELQRWFNERRREMTGFCHHCNSASCKNDDNYFKFSIGHILPKALFPSVKTHPKNFIELCFWNNSCHSQLDNNMLDLIDMNCFDEIVTKFVAIYPDIDKKERKRIPEILMQYIEVEK